VLDATHQSNYPAEVVAVGTDRTGVQALSRAERAGIPNFTVRVADHADRAAWDKALTQAVTAYRPDLVVSAGFMKILGPDFLGAFPNRVINTHPALLPSFPGMHAVADALALGVKVTGSTVHFVDAGMDSGPIIAQEAVVVESDDDEAVLHERIKAVERRLLVETIEKLGRGGCIVEGRKVRFS
jgi:phosphoribosylglycinamide formyltransferase-1